MIDTLALIDAAEARMPFAGWADAPARIADRWTRFQAFLQSAPPPRVYGVNTLPGHRMADHTDLSPQQINRAILRSHVSGWGERFDAREIAYLTAAKITALTVGGVPISPSTWGRLVDWYATADFAAAAIPRHASYSCGDVVPAAHWAAAIIGGADQSDVLAPGEVMSLINGNFVSLGAAMSLILPLARSFAAALANEAVLIDLTDAPREMIAASYQGCSRHARRSLELLVDAAGHDDAPLWEQLPVSLRALPQLASLRIEGLAALNSTVGASLARPSGNPLFDPEASIVISQASFLCLDVSMAVDRLIGTLLAAMWNLTERLKYLVTHAGEAIGDNPILMIQLPKLVQAELENARRRHGVRAFASGGATSSGVEDFWGFTLPLANDLIALNQRYRAVIAIERHILALLRPGSVAPLAHMSPTGMVIDEQAWASTDEGWYRELLNSLA